MRLVLDRWEWHTDAAGSGWRKPGGDYTGGCLDLRTLMQAGTPGPAPAGLGLFAYEDLPFGLVPVADLGDDPLAVLTVARRRDLGTALGLDPRQLGGTTLADVLAEDVLGELADPSGRAATKPLRVNRRGCALHLKGFGRLYHHRLDKAHPAYAQTLAVRRLDYERTRTRLLDRAAKLGTDPDIALDALRRWTGWDMLALGASEEDLLPASRLSDGYRAPSTTLIETWPSDGTTFATTQDNPWTVEQGAAAVASGVLTTTLDNAGALAGGTYLSCDTALSSDDHSHEASSHADSTSGGSGTVLIVRFDATITSTLPTQGYYCQHVRDVGFELARIGKWVAGVQTALADDTGGVAQDVTVYGEADGSAISALIGGIVLGPVTDTDITGTLSVGCAVTRNTTNQASATLDNHTMADLAAADPEGQLIGGKLVGSGILGGRLVA